jgi:hypothetical protein
MMVLRECLVMLDSKEVLENLAWTGKLYFNAVK